MTAGAQSNTGFGRIVRPSLHHADFLGYATDDKGNRHESRRFCTSIEAFQGNNMKIQVRLALLCLAASPATAFAQSTPQCGSTNYDQARSSYTIMNPAAGVVNQQCFITVYPTGAPPALARQNPASYLIEGSYAIVLSGGGGGGGAGAMRDKGGGGGGAGAAPVRSDRFLAPGEYKLTIGTGGAGATTGVRSRDGNPSSIVNVSTGQLVAGSSGADRAAAVSSSGPSDGRGGVGLPGGSTGGSGGDSGAGSEKAAQAGSMSQSTGTSMPGQAGTESGRTAGRTVQANAGGGGGAGVGAGGDGASANSSATQGRLGAGGGGGAGSVNFAGPGAAGGNGFIRLALTALAPQAAAPAPAAAPAAAAAPSTTVVVMAPVIQKYSMSSDALFGFGKSTLRPEGKAKLDELISSLKSVDIDTILSTGHADRIGSPELNQRLSMQRAETVKAYMVSNGVQAYRNSAVGMGESQPVTNANDCRGATSPKIIACLQADRRVDVEVVVSRKN